MATTLVRRVLDQARGSVKLLLRDRVDQAAGKVTGATRRTVRRIGSAEKVEGAVPAHKRRKHFRQCYQTLHTQHKSLYGVVFFSGIAWDAL